MLPPDMADMTARDSFGDLSTETSSAGPSHALRRATHADVPKVNIDQDQSNRNSDKTPPKSLPRRVGSFAMRELFSIKPSQKARLNLCRQR